MTTADVERVLSDWLLASARTLPVAWSIPGLGGAVLPAVIRLAIGLGLSYWCTRFIGAHPLGLGSLMWLLMLVRESFVGIVLAFVASCMIRAAESAGQLIDLLRDGQSNGARLSLSGQQISPMALLMILLAAIAFFQIGGPSHVAWSLQRSYEAIPLAPRHPMNVRGAATIAILASAALIESAIGLAAPILVAALLADVLVGVLGRAVPELPLPSVGAPLKSVVVAVVLLIGLGGMQLGLRHTLGAFLRLLRGAWVY